METTLDLVESCLQDVYRIRKASLLTRSKQYREKMVRQQSDVTPLVEKVFDKRQGGDDDDEEEEEEESVKLMEFMSKNISKTTTPINLETIYEEFCVELKSIYATKNLDDETQLESACTHLIEKYFTEKLDKLPPSSELSAVKRKISSAIEEMAAGNFAEQSKQEPAIPTEKNGGKQHLNQVNKSTEAEQRNIKKQYESYMQLRKKTQNHSEVSTIEEYEKLNSEIKNVLSSIKSIK